jgi:hypothetical protein
VNEDRIVAFPSAREVEKLPDMRPRWRIVARLDIDDVVDA